MTDLAEMAEINIDEDLDEPLPLITSQYENDEMFASHLLTYPGKLCVLSMNCESLNAKISELRIYIYSLKSKGCTIGAICLQECWFSDKSNKSIYQIDDYNLEVVPASASKKGVLLSKHIILIK